MAAPDIREVPVTPERELDKTGRDDDQILAEDQDADTSGQQYQPRFSARYDLQPSELSSTASPSQLKRTIEAHLHETDRRLEDTQQLGTSLVKQREELAKKLEEVEQFQDEAQVPSELRKKWADIEKEHADISREVARALLVPKSKQDDPQLTDSGVLTSQATGSPTKISAPSRRHRNQPSTRAGDLQFAADISTSLLAQVRQLQATVAERDETIKRSEAEREAIEHDLQTYAQKLRALDESEQKYKDENWNLETQKHELLVAARDSGDKEKRLNAGLTAALSEKTRLQNELDELKMNHSKLTEEHLAARKAHDTEVHGLKRNIDLVETEQRTSQDKIDELISQNQELAKAISTRSRSRQISPGEGFLSVREEFQEHLDSPDESPPASPTKATPRHGALESETLRSSLHHAHRMIQNLKGNIHREKTEKIELRRMLQDARDELETKRSDAGSAAKRQKSKPEPFKKPSRPDMLGGSRRSRTDIELTDDDWEDNHPDSPTHGRPVNTFQTTRPGGMTDFSDAYQTANETENNFDTADERNTTESEAFMTGAESLAGDSTDELTETEDTASRSGRPAFSKSNRLSARHVGDKSYHSRADSTSADENELSTPMQPAFAKFKLRSRGSYNKSLGLGHDNTPESVRSASLSQASPSTVTQSPALGERSLFAELGGMDDFNSDTHSTPARSSTMSSTRSTPGYAHSIDEPMTASRSTSASSKMVDSSTMTDSTLQANPRLLPAAFVESQTEDGSASLDVENAAQHTPQKSLADSPVRPTSSHITPPKTVWDEEHETSSTTRDPTLKTAMGYSHVLSQNSDPVQSPVQKRDALQEQVQLHRAEMNSKQRELDDMRADHAAALAATAAELKILRDSHQSAINTKDAESEALRSENAAALARLQEQLQEIQSSHATSISKKESELAALHESHAVVLQQLGTELENLKSAHTVALSDKDSSIRDLQAQHSSALTEKDSMLKELHMNHANAHMQHVAALDAKDASLRDTQEQHAKALSQKEIEMQTLIADHERVVAERNQHIQALQAEHESARTASQEQIDKLNESHSAVLSNKDAELKALLAANATAIALKEAELVSLRSEHTAAWQDKGKEIDDLGKAHASAILGKDNEMQALRDAHDTARDTHATELSSLRKAHLDDQTALKASLEAQQQQVADLQSELEALRSSHGKVIASKDSELESLQSVHNAHVDKSKLDSAMHAEELEKKRLEIEELRKIQESELEGLRTQLSGHDEELGSRKTEIEKLQAVHAAELESLKRQLLGSSDELDSRLKELESLRSAHAEELSNVQSQAATHLQELNRTKAELESLETNTAAQSDKLNAQIVAHIEQLTARDTQLQNLQSSHNQVLSDKDAEMAKVQLTHNEALSSAQEAHDKEKLALTALLAAHARDLDASQSASAANDASHASEIEKLKAQISAYEQQVGVKDAELNSLRMSHEAERSDLTTRLTELGQEMTAKSTEVNELRAVHEQNMADLLSKHGIDSQALNSRIEAQEAEMSSKQTELANLTDQHAQELNRLQSQATQNDSLLSTLRESHAAELEALRGQVAAQGTEHNNLLASLQENHAVELQGYRDQIAAQNLQINELRTALEALQAQKTILAPGYSAILSQESEPVMQTRSRSASPERPRTAERITTDDSLLAAGVAGSVPQTRHSDDVFGSDVAKRNAGQGDQTQRNKKSAIGTVAIPARSQSPGTRTPASPTRYPARPSSRSRDVATIPEDGDMAMPSSPPPRPASANSYRTSSFVSQSQPPLPSDHKDIIARANSKVGSPVRQPRQAGIMGPPALPASAMRRPKTPSESVRTGSRAGQGKRATGSQMSRRSSVSSFASELDERFNIRTDQQVAGPGFEAGPGTDPRMIQAITQTMIGEYLWKYTRKAGSKEMSNTRHRRYFWVHPYTRTLYWSDKDPQTAGRSELKAKSVQIESVRVVSDDNPMPPGLHRKSLEIITPGRKIKFTASTGQRHETWFNALSYLLHRGEDNDAPADVAGSTEVTPDDLAEFNVNGYGARLIPNDRMSMSSYNSRTTSGTTRRVRPSMEVGANSSTSQSKAAAGIQNSDTNRQSRLAAPVPDKDRTLRASSRTRIAKMFGSVNNRTKSDNTVPGESSSQARDSSIYNASIVSDRRKEEEEETRRLQEQSERPGLEDVRACCDGQHHVGSLAHRHPSSSSTNRFSSAINRSMSRRN